MKSIILTHSGYQDQEVIYPYYRLQEEGDVCLIAERVGKIRGILGTEIEAAGTYAMLFPPSDLPRASDGHLLVLPGGVKAMEKLRQDLDALAFVKNWFELGRPLASMCSGAQLLISARVPFKGRRLAAYPAMQVDVENAGATYVDAGVVTDGFLVSSPHYRFLSTWLREAIRIARGYVRA